MKKYILLLFLIITPLCYSQLVYSKINFNGILIEGSDINFYSKLQKQGFSSFKVVDNTRWFKGKYMTLPCFVGVEFTPISKKVASVSVLIDHDDIYCLDDFIDAIFYKFDCVEYPVKDTSEFRLTRRYMNGSFSLHMTESTDFIGLFFINDSNKFTCKKEIERLKFNSIKSKRRN